MMDLWLVQGEKRDPLSCNVLGHFEFYGIPPRPALDSKLSVTYRYNANGIVEVEATDLVDSKMLSHRISADRYTLKDVLNDQIPAHIAVIVDSSGSMYGEPMDAARIAVKRFVESSLKPYRTMALFSYPGSGRPNAGPGNDPNQFITAVDGLIPIGESSLHKSLFVARKGLKDRGGIYVIVSDGKVDDTEAVLKECERIRKQGGRIFTIGVGPAVDKTFLKELCAAEKDYFDAFQSLDISHALINIVTEIPTEEVTVV